MVAEPGRVRCSAGVGGVPRVADRFHGMTARASAAALSCAAIVAVIDVVAVAGHPLAAVVADVDVAAGIFAAAAVQLALASLACLAVLCVAAGSRRGSRAPLGASVVVFALAVVLNRELLAHRPLVWLLLVGFALAHAVLVWALPRFRRLAIAVGLVVGVALAIANGWTYRGVNPQQHATLVLAVWSFLVPTIVAAARRLADDVPANPRPWRMLGVLSWGAALVFVVQSFHALRDAPAGARLVLRETAPAARATFDGLAPALELDGDGEAGWPVGGDCAPFDGAIAASRPEIAGDGIDQNCLAGDPNESDVAALAVQLAGPDSTTTRRATRLLLVTIDALRHDARLPEMEARVGSRCTKLDRAYSTNNETTFASYSLFASRFPSQGVFTAVGPYTVPIHDPAPRLPGLLGEAGFATMAIAFHNRFDPRLGLTTGFADVWMTEATPEAIFAVAGETTTDRALAWLDGRAAPWMLWVHYYDPHEPYLVHPEVPLPEMTPRHAYDGEVEYTDRQIARLFDALAELDDIAIVVTADHGEAFGEHGTRFHGTDLFEEQIRIPMWICPPRDWPRAPAQPIASLVDVAPTMLELAGLPRPATFVGRSLLHGGDGDVPAFAESIVGARMQAVVAPPWKLVRYLDGDVRLLFDLDRDPAELDDRVGMDDAHLTRTSALLDAWAGLVARD